MSVYTSSSVLGPYTKRSVLAGEGAGVAAFGAQQTDIFAYTDSAGEAQFMYIGE